MKFIIAQLQNYQENRPPNTLRSMHLHHHKIHKDTVHFSVTIQQVLHLFPGAAPAVCGGLGGVRLNLRPGHLCFFLPLHQAPRTVAPSPLLHCPGGPPRPPGSERGGERVECGLPLPPGPCGAPPPGGFPGLLLLPPAIVQVARGGICICRTWWSPKLAAWVRRGRAPG